MSRPPPAPHAAARPRGYVLLEIIIALTVFAVVVTGLTSVLHSSLDAANILRRQSAVQRGLEAVLIEAQHKPRREEMVLSFKDEALGVEYRSELEELKWVNRKGKPIKGLFVLRAVATDLRASRPIHNAAEVYVYPSVIPQPADGSAGSRCSKSSSG